MYFAEIFHRCMVFVPMREKASVWAAHHHHLIPLRWPCCARLKSNFCCCSFSAASFFLCVCVGGSKRVYHEFGHQVVLREYSEREDSFERLKTRGLPIQNSLYRSACFFLSIHFFCFLFSPFLLFPVFVCFVSATGTAGPALLSVEWNVQLGWIVLKPCVLCRNPDEFSKFLTVQKEFKEEFRLDGHSVKA